MSDTQLVLELNFEYSGVVAGISEIQDAISGLERSISLSMNAMVQMTDAEKALTSQTASFERALGVSSTAAKDLKTETDALVEVINNNADAFENNKAKADLARQSIQEQIDKYNKYGEEVPPNLEAVQELLKETTEKGMSLGDIGTHLKNFADYASQVVGPLMEMAGASTRTKEQVNGMIDGVSKVGEGLTQLATNPVAGTINIITGALKFGLNAWQMWKDQGVRAAIAEERNLIDISAEVEEKIVKLADKLNDAHAATSVYMAEIIKGAKINESNFDNYVSRTSEIIDDYKNKKLDLDQTQEALGKSFNAILTEAQKLGTEGSAEMVALIERIQSSGIKVGEVMDYVNQRIEKGTQAMSKYLSTFNITSITKSIADLKKELESKNVTQAREVEIHEELKKKQLELAMVSEDVRKNWSLMETVALAAFDQMEKGGGNFVENVIKMQEQLDNLKTLAGAAGIEIKSRLKEMVDVAAFLDQNKVLTFRLEQTKELMESLGGTAGASQELFTKFSSYVVDAYNDMIAGGLGNEKALQLLKPQLEKINEIAGQYKVTISEQTENLLEKGRTAEVIAKKEKENFERVHDFLLGSVRLFKEELPEAAEVGLGKIGRTIDVEGIKKNLRTVIESVQKQFAEPGMGGYQLNLSFGETERWVSDILPSFMEFLEVLDSEYGINLDFTDANKSIDQVQKHIKIFSDSVKEKLGWNFDETRGMSSISKLIRGFGLVQKEIEKERKLRVDTEPAEMSIADFSTAFGFLGNMFLMPLGVNLVTAQAQAALMGLYQIFGQMMQVFLTPIGINFDFSSIISSMIGLQNVQKDVKSGTTVLTEEQKKWKIAVAETSEKYNILESDAVEPTRMLKEETAKVLAVLAKNKAAFENNAVGAEKLREMLRDHLELYKKYKKDPPETLKQVIEDTNTLTKAQMDARNSAKSMLDSFQLTEDSVSKLNMESEALVAQMNDMTKAGNLSEDQQKRLKEALLEQLQKYKDLSQASPIILQLAKEWDLIDQKTNKARTSVDEVKKKMDEFDKSLGFIKDKDALTAGMNKLTASLKRNEEQWKNSPELAQKMIDKMDEYEKQAKQAGIDLPKGWDDQKKAIQGVIDANEKLKKAQGEMFKDLEDYLGMSKEEFEDLGADEQKAAEARARAAKEIGKIGSALGASQKDIQGFSKGWEDLFQSGGSITDKMQTMGKMTGFAGNMLKDMGIVSGSTASRIALVGQGIGQVGSGVAGLISGNPMKMIEGVIKIAKGIGNIIKGLFGDKWERRAKKALKGLEGVTDEMTQQLKKKAKEMGSTTLAMNELMASFIKQAAITTEKGLEGWSGKVVGMMDQLKNVSGADAAKLTQQIGDSFNAMVEKADKLNLHGSKAMVGMIQKARELNKEGKKIPEVFEYVNERLTKGAEAISNYIGTFGDVAGIQGEIAGINDQLRAGNVTAAEAAKLQGELGGKQAELNSAVKDIRENWDFIQTASLSTFTAMMDSGKSFVEVVREMGDQLTGLGDMAKLSGMEISGGLKEMTDLADFVQQNEKLATRIEATNQMMEALGDTSYMTAEDFTNFSTNAQKQFDDLINAGATEKQALRLLGPQLENLIKYQKTYGLTIDEQTNSLINRAKQEGVLGKQAKTEGEQQIDLQERMVSILEGIGEHFGVKIPKAMDEMASTGESSMSRLEAHWEGMGYDVDEMRERIGKHLPFGYRAMMEAAIAANRAAQDSAPIESINQWKFSLEEVEETIRTNLLEANQELDAASQTAIGNIINYLKNTSEEGSNTTMTFGEIKEKIEELGGSYETLLGESPEAFLEISDKMKEKIDELTLTMGDSHAATSTLMSQIIAQADIDVTNFDLYAARTGEIIEDYKNGALDLEQTSEAMGAAFNNILGEAQRLGTEGSEQMVGMLQAAREAGVEVAEMHEYVNSKLQDGVTSLATYIKSFEGSEEKGSKKKEEIAANWEFMQSMAMASFNALEEQGYSFVESLGMMQQPLADLGKMAKENGLDVSEGLQRMTNIATFNEQNQALMSRIEATRGMMEALGDTAFLTANDFTMFAQQTTSQFDEVLAKSGDQETALRLVAPALEDLIKYADSYGFAIDENTQALIDQGIEQGLVSEQTKTDAQVTNDLLMLIAETLGATIPDNLKNLGNQVGESMAAAEGQTGAWSNSLANVEGQLANNLPNALKNFDSQYDDAMSGHSIITQTEKWRTSLSGAEEQLKGQLPGSLQAVKSVAENTFSGAGDKTVLFGKKVDDLKTRLKEKLTSSLQELEQKGGGAFDKLKEKGGIFAKMADKLKEKTKKELTEALAKLEQKGSGVFDLLGKKTYRLTAVTGETKDKIKIEMLDALKKVEIQGTQSLSKMVKETGTWQDKLSSVKGQLSSDLPGAVKNLDNEYTEAMTGHSVVTETAKWSNALQHVQKTIDTDLIGSTRGLDKSFVETMSRIKDKLGDMEKDLQRTAIEGGNLDEVFQEYASSLGISTGQLKTLLGESSSGVIEISEEMQKKIDELTETMGDAHAAESTLVNEIIRDAEITVSNFDTYAQRTREILTDYASGALDLKQTQEAMGSSFSELLKKAQELGTEGSKQMIALLKDVRTSGIEVAEMQDYVNDKLNKGVDALDKYISSFKSTTTLKDEYGDLNKQLSDNLEALEKVEAQMLEGGKTQQELNELRKEAARLEEERSKLLDDTIAKENELGTTQKEIAENWDFMQAATLSTFKALESEGHSFVEIVGMMDGQLTNLAQMAEENGLTVSEGIKEMTDMATFVEQNEGLANRIDATKTMMEALGDTAYMKAGDFAMFSDQTKKQFDEIIAKGGDSQMALRLMAPALEDLVKYSESYGYTIDANTQSLIDQAREQGLLSEQQKTDAQVTNDILLLIAETLGAVIPESLQETTGAIQRQQESFEEAAGAMEGDLAGLGQAAIEKGAEVQEGLNAMTDKEALDEYTREMLQDIEETQNEMAYLGESALLTDEQFAGFSENIQERFMNIAAKTGDSETALRLLGPALEDITAYSERYGFAIDENTRALIHQADQQEILAKETEEGTKAANEHLMEMAKKYGFDIPDSLKVLTYDVNDSMKKIEEKTGDWNSSLDDVEGKIKEDLPKAIRDLDADYTDAMTGHSIVTETGKWKHSLEDVNHILGRELLETAENLNQKYKHVSGNIYQYLQKTSKGGYIARMSFDKMVKELERVKNAYDKMAIKKRLSDKDKNIMEDYKRQIQELSEAIEETAPTLENFGKKFKEFQDRLAGDIGVNRGMIEMARGLREQGQSLKEIDDIIDKSLTSGSKGLGAWVNALGPAKKEIEELKKLQEDIEELREKEELKEGELAKLEKMEADLLNRRTDAQKLFLQDQEELLNTQDMVVAYFHSMRAEGKSVSEIMEVMGDSFENLAEKSMAQLTGTAGFEMTNAFSNLYNMQRKMADNEDLIKGVEGLTQALHGMGDSMLYMSDEEFGRFETSAVSAFEKLKDAGFDQKQSLQLIAPILKDLKSYAAEYGFSLDQSTARMLKNAQKEGVLRKQQKSDTEKLVEVNRQLAGVMERVAGTLEKLGTVSPFAQLADEAQALETQTARLKGFERQRKTVAKEIELAKSQAQRLIDDMATAGGISTETGAGIFELLLKKEEELENLIKKQTDIEKGYNRTRTEVERLREEYNKNMPKEGDYISAALGYHGILKSDKWFRLHKGEQVDVWSPEETQRIQATPIRSRHQGDTRGSVRGGDIVFEHITIQSENGEEAVKDFMTAIKGNKYGVQNLIRKVAH